MFASPSRSACWNDAVGKMSFAVVALILGAVLGFTPGAAPAQPPASAVCTPLPGYRPPVDAPVIDPFRAP
ncbi:MAG: hypothetical protein QOJ19_2102, partial [Acidimicrobiia bacterium]|nr:hypothetical protein [Acidimicrobiia bacterium]